MFSVCFLFSLFYPKNVVQSSKTHYKWVNPTASDPCDISVVTEAVLGLEEEGLSTLQTIGGGGGEATTPLGPGGHMRVYLCPGPIRDLDSLLVWRLAQPCQRML